VEPKIEILRILRYFQPFPKYWHFLCFYIFVQFLTLFLRKKKCTILAAIFGFGIFSCSYPKVLEILGKLEAAG